MKKPVLHTLSVLALALGVFAGHAVSQDTALPAGEAEEPRTESESGFDALLGLWVRPDGGYLIAIRGVDASGRLDAAYANPHQLPFAKAEASREGNRIKVFLELRAGGYNGSTYTLTYDPEQGYSPGRLLPGGRAAEVRRLFRTGQVAIGSVSSAIAQRIDTDAVAGRAITSV